MGGLAKFLVIFGIGSAVLHLLHRELVILFWIDTWGETVGWAIRIGMIAVGVVLWVLSASASSRSGPAPSA